MHSKTHNKAGPRDRMNHTGMFYLVLLVELVLVDWVEVHQAVLEQG